jgi:hypothetical protein
MLLLKMHYFRIHEWLTLHINKVYARAVLYNDIYIYIYIYIFLIVSLLPTHCTRRGLLLLLITLGHATLSRTLLDEWSADRRGLYLYNTQHSQETIQINQPTRCNSFSSLLLDVYVQLLMMGVRTPETCWAVHKRQVINLRKCCI